MAPPGAADLARLQPAERLARLGARVDGLTASEAIERTARFGPNEPVRTVASSALASFAANFTHTLALLLWFAAGLAFAAGIAELGAAIVAVVAINGVFAFIQEYRAGQVVAGLTERVAIQARVRREGELATLPATALVPGDIVSLAAGDIVPADCALIESDGLAVDLSLLTGETQPVERLPDPQEVPGPVHLAEIACLLPAGAGVVTGRAEAVVWATGPASSTGQIAALVQSVERGDSALERQVAALSRVAAMIAVGAGALTLSLAGVATDTTFLAALTFGTGVLVALVPEGLLPTLSISLAIGARRMADRGAAVRRLAAVEVVGSVTVVCTDKTGTLTENRLAVSTFMDGDGTTKPSRDALFAAVLCNDVRADGGVLGGDPFDVALFAWAAAQGAAPEALRSRYPRAADLPFDARRRYQAVTCTLDGRPRSFAKGAPEAVLAVCGEPAPPPSIAEALAAATGRGERVLLLAAGDSFETLRLAGLLTFRDPPRAGVADAIRACGAAGIRIVMLTGDHPETARAMATAIGLGGPSIAVADGHDVDAMGERELVGFLQGDAIVARVDPAQKLRIVQALRRAGEIVVVTGDGVNDAPALRAADVGVAMGRRGTEVAKQAADIVLADDNFATIVAAIEEGRSIKANIRRFVSYVFTSNVAEMAPFMLYIFLPVPLPLAVIQALAIDVGTDLVPALALGAEAPSERTMRRPPEPPSRPLLTRELGLLTFLFFGVIEALLGLAGFFAFYLVEGWRPFESMTPWAAIHREATTVTFLAIVGGQVGCLVAQRGGGLRARLSLRTNRLIGAGFAFELVLALVLVYVPGVNRLLSMRAVEVEWLAAVPVAALVFTLLDLGRRAVAPRVRR